MLFIPLLAAAAAAAPSTQPLAAKAGVADDVRCMVAFMLAAGASKDKEQASAVADTLYYLGRIDRKAPTLVFDKAVEELVTQPDYLDKQAASDLERCATTMNGVGDRLQNIGKAMAALDKSGEPAAAPAPAPVAPTPTAPAADPKPAVKVEFKPKGD